MFAFFGLGMAEILILGLTGLVIIIVPLAIALSVSRQSRGATAPNEVALLRAEVERLREEVEHLRKQAGNKEPPDAIKAGPN